MEPNELYILNSERPLTDSLEDLDSARVLNSPAKGIPSNDQPLKMPEQPSINIQNYHKKPSLVKKFPTIEEEDIETPQK